MIKIRKFKVPNYQEFIKLKSVEPFFTMRLISKSINFLMLFGGGPKVFVKKFLETAWTEDQCDKYIEENDLEELKEQIQDIYKRDSPKMWKYLTCAAFIRNSFFKLYSKLTDWHTREVNFASCNGYIRAPHGAIRRLPELLLQDKDDKRLYGGIIRNLGNIAKNSPIQNFESCIVNLGIIELAKWLRKNNMKTYIFNSVHDSIDIMIYKPEAKKVLLKAREILEKDREVYQGFPIAVDGEISDLSKGEIYKVGTDIDKFLKTN